MCCHVSECGEYQKIICEILAPADAAELDTRCWLVDRDVGPSSRLYSSLCQCHHNQRGLGASSVWIIREVYSVVGPVPFKERYFGGKLFITHGHLRDHNNQS